MEDYGFDKSDREQIIDLIDRLIINDEYKSALTGVSNWLLNDTHIWRDNTIRDVSIFMEDAKRRLVNIRSLLSDNDCISLEALEETILHRYNDRLMRTIVRN